MAAEAPPGGVCWFAADGAALNAELEDGHVVIDLAAHGPAGASSVELPDGGVLRFDHLDPTHLLGVESDLVDPFGSPLLVALFGVDGARRITEQLQLAVPAAAGGGQDRVDDSPRVPAAGRVVPFGRNAPGVGTLVLLADLATDPAADPLARVVAASEFIGGLEATPGGDLFAPAIPDVVAHANVAASRVEDAMLASLDRSLGHRILEVLQPLLVVAPDGDDRSHLFVLAQRIDQATGRDDDERRLPAAMRSTVPPPADDYWIDELASVAVAAGDEVSEPTVRFVRRSPSLIEVTTFRSQRRRWVRVLRSDGMIPLALVPLRSDGLMECAELVVPPDTDTADLEFHLVDADALGQLSGTPTDLVRRAVRAGRAAASAERRGDRLESMRRWQRCAELWHRLGDGVRVRQALDRGASSREGRMTVCAILADELDPYGADTQLDP